MEVIRRNRKVLERGVHIPENQGARSHLKGGRRKEWTTWSEYAKEMSPACEGRF